MHRIFIVEDDAAIAAALQKHLTTWGFDVRCAEDFRNVLAECTAFDPQLVLLDITLPFYNGYHWCQELRRVSNVPVVFLSSASDLSLIHISSTPARMPALSRMVRMTGSLRIISASQPGAQRSKNEMTSF